ncbi:hypothetical protein ARMGADRAFT_1029706 [Armillaria gallica]|uniref:Uncharacterized protein n=1 Tax=Armillaria gallica TaxID=47427 RepID=A0A2H3DF34_ARMGA|nr:hypothetical protein ARMGADRAFT_1029706 [Armillaria gallica]
MSRQERSTLLSYPKRVRNKYARDMRPVIPVRYEIGWKIWASGKKMAFGRRDRSGCVGTFRAEFAAPVVYGRPTLDRSQGRLRNLGTQTVLTANERVDLSFAYGVGKAAFGDHDSDDFATVVTSATVARSAQQWSAPLDFFRNPVRQYFNVGTCF